MASRDRTPSGVHMEFTKGVNLKNCIYNLIFHTRYYIKISEKYYRFFIWFIDIKNGVLELKTSKFAYVSGVSPDPISPQTPLGGSQRPPNPH